MKYQISEIQINHDHEDFITFREKNFDEQFNYKFSNFYLNPRLGNARCWVLVHPDKKAFIGSASIFPRKMYCRNCSDCIAGITGDFGVVPKHRSLGPALKLQRHLINSFDSNKFSFWYGYTNDLSYPVQKRAGFKTIGNAERFVKVLKSRNYLKRYVKTDFVLGLLSNIIDFALYILSKEAFVRLGSQHDIEILQRPDHRFDKLWNTEKIHHNIIGERTNDFIFWRLKATQSKNYRIFTLVRSDTKELEGYIIYYPHRNEIKVADYLSKDCKVTSKRLFASFLSYLRKMKKYKSVSITYFGEKSIGFFLKSFSFTKRADENKFLVYTAPESSLNDDIIDKNNWYFFEIDSDT